MEGRSLAMLEIIAMIKPAFVGFVPHAVHGIFGNSESKKSRPEFGFPGE
jgi:hypothetical protein